MERKWARRGGLHALLQPMGQQNGHWFQGMSSAAAMVAATFQKIKSDDEYIAIRSKYGDTTSVEAHLKALRELGLQAEFRKDGDADMVELEVENGRPVLVGWLHHGNMLRGEPPMCNGLGCGH